jgi:cytochrome c5
MRALIAATVLASSATFAFAALGQTAPGPPPTSMNLPEGEGRDLLMSACSSCHALSAVTIKRDGPAGWRHHMSNMVLRGAQLNEREMEVVLAYLVTNFGPTAPIASATPITLPEGPERQTVETLCAACHDLERVTTARRDAAAWDAVVGDMLGRLGSNDPDARRRIAAYLASHYGTHGAQQPGAQ